MNLSAVRNVDPMTRALSKPVGQRRSEDVAPIVAFIKNIKVFSEIDHKSLVKVAKAVELVIYDEGQYIFQEGQVGSIFYIVLDGNIAIQKKKRIYEADEIRTEIVTLVNLGWGQYFGEAALENADGLRTATAQATKISRLLKISVSVYHEILADFKNIMQKDVVHTLTGPHSIFKDWDRDKIEHIARFATLRHYNMNDEVITHGKNCNSVMLLKTGIIRIIKGIPMSDFLLPEQDMTAINKLAKAKVKRPEDPSPSTSSRNASLHGTPGSTPKATWGGGGHTPKNVAKTPKSSTNTPKTPKGVLNMLENTSSIVGDFITAASSGHTPMSPPPATTTSSTTATTSTQKPFLPRIDSESISTDNLTLRPSLLALNDASPTKNSKTKTAQPKSAAEVLAVPVKRRTFSVSHKKSGSLHNHVHQNHNTHEEDESKMLGSYLLNKRGTIEGFKDLIGIATSTDNLSRIHKLEELPERAEPVVEFSVAVLMSGDFLGEIAVLDPDQLSPITAIASTNVEVYCFDGELLTSLDINANMKVMNALALQWQFNNPPEGEIVKFIRQRRKWQVEKKLLVRDMKIK